MPLGRLARKSGHAVVSPISEMKSRRLICPPANHRSGRDYSRKKSPAAGVAFGSKATVPTLSGHVGYAPESDLARHRQVTDQQHCGESVRALVKANPSMSGRYELCHSGLTLASLIIGHHLSISAF